MENAADALQMAAFVLIFVLALSISINAFGEARQSAQIILGYQDREYDYTYIEPDENSSTQRIVGAETIIPSMYKAYRENYKIVFVNLNLPNGLYQKKGKDGEWKDIYSIDMEKGVVVGSEAQKEEFINAILYGANPDTQEKIRVNLGIKLNNEGIYDILKKNSFVEKLGVYYQEEIYGESETPNTNKTEKRVITYEMKNS